MPATEVPAGIYGTVICASILATADDERPAKVAIVVIVTLVVYWLAERYAEVLGLAASPDEGNRGVDGAPTKITADHIRHVLGSGWSMIEASVTPPAGASGKQVVGH